MDPDTWNAYHIVSNRARSVCYATRQQLFRRRAELTVNALISTATSQLDAMKDLKVELGSRRLNVAAGPAVTGLTLQTGGAAGAEGADRGVSGQAARGPPCSADAAGQTA